jgi:NAD(P)-dependent dehydrogenase (short-subunit alcohol dehydrogenase family)
VVWPAERLGVSNGSPVVNNAAFQEHILDFEDLTEIHFDRTLKTNLYGYFQMAKAAVPHMKPGSAIVMTGWVHRPNV